MPYKNKNYKVNSIGLLFLVAPFLFLFSLVFVFNGVRAATGDNIQVSFVSPSASLNINETQTVSVTTSGGSDDVTGYSFSIIVPEELEISNLQNHINQSFFASYLRATYSSTLHANKIGALYALDSGSSFSLPDSTSMISFEITPKKSGTYDIIFQPDFSNSIIDSQGNDIMDSNWSAMVLTITISENLVINNVNVETGNTYEVMSNGLILDANQYIDRNYTFDSIPASLLGITYFKTANNNKSTRSNTHLSFNVNQDVTVYVAHDNRYALKPAWLDGTWTDTNEDIGAPGAGTFSVFSKDFNQGSVVLGGNVNPQEIENNSMYTVAVVGKKAASQVINVAPSVEAGNNIIVTNPDVANLQGSYFDDGLPNPPAQVTLLWSKQQGAGNVTFSNPDQLYTTALFDTAGTYILQLAADDGEFASTDTLEVVVKDPLPLEVTNVVPLNGQNYTVSKNGLIIGVRPYIDRDYVFGYIPSYLLEKTYIKTANNDKQSTETPFVSFDVNQDVTVYVAHDTRFSIKPVWLDGTWTNTGDIIEAPVAGTFTLYKKDFAQGKIILGGNTSPLEVENNSMYSIIVTSQLAIP
ncbi:hypothetical protein COV24_01000 [candidate division WWE3 bacterium CG10_big_fil_rev_8_21_14_0_10_32_10]|uniref:Uncharacterized protein n=1 Tax=candidate division WWE3 bacterium CG10_big_fil_rev_8_21_14_0_10_32_10 TaxID=1975090 RepID=A0A2H0RB88_UNCKA|nr:MAG: hypothetical protein COV24_01000 [candidate division WWE3 bacterium CG10_big_fil_rev_8_21_14_0_10_32_10]